MKLKTFFVVAQTHKIISHKNVNVIHRETGVHEMITLTCDVRVLEWDIVHAGYLDLDLSTDMQSLMQLI